jgi:hypothetical protein
MLLREFTTYPRARFARKVNQLTMWLTDYPQARPRGQSTHDIGLGGWVCDRMMTMGANAESAGCEGELRYLIKRYGYYN